MPRKIEEAEPAKPPLEPMARDRRRASVYAEGNGPDSSRQRVVACQAAHARGRTAVHAVRSVHSLWRGRAGPVDEIVCATVDQRAVADAREVCQVFALNRGIMVHCNTSVYIARNEVEPRLGRNMHV
jgi:hypothetical protein